MDLITIRRAADRTWAVHVRDQCVKCDMSVADGGQGLGMSPVELFAGSLGACIAIIVQGWCEACGHAGDVDVGLTLELEAEPRRIGVIAVDVELPAGVPADRRDAVQRLVEHCVIHESLVAPPDVDVDIQLDSERSPARVD